jgi:hypothetical protein
MEIDGNDIALSIIIAMNLSSQGKPCISVPSCAGGVDHLDVHFHGGASWWVCCLPPFSQPLQFSFYSCHRGRRAKWDTWCSTF